MAKILIELNTDLGDTLDKALRMLSANSSTQPVTLPEFDVPSRPMREASAAAVETRAAEKTAAAEDTVATAQPISDVVKTDTSELLLTEYDGQRKRGTALNGGRRTKAQIESDTLYFDQERNRGADKARDSSGVKTQTFKTAEAAVAAMEAGVEPSISSGEERVNPEDEQDEASEAAESAEPTLETLRAAYVRYSNKFGVPAAIKDIKVILGCGVAEVPKDEVPEALAKIEAAMAAENIDAYLATLREPEKAPTATKAQLMAAIMGYGKKYDDTEKPDDMTLTKQDLPVIFTELFGVGVTGLGSMKEQTPEAFGVLLAAIRQATETNRFERKVKGK